jgi:hypothetical protein
LPYVIDEEDSVMSSARLLVLLGSLVLMPLPANAAQTARVVLNSIYSSPLVGVSVRAVDCGDHYESCLRQLVSMDFSHASEAVTVDLTDTSRFLAFQGLLGTQGSGDAKLPRVGHSSMQDPQTPRYRIRKLTHSQAGPLGVEVRGILELDAASPSVDPERRITLQFSI